MNILLLLNYVHIKVYLIKLIIFKFLFKVLVKFFDSPSISPYITNNNYLVSSNLVKIFLIYIHLNLNN